MDRVMLYLRYISITLKSEMEYRYSFIMHLFIQVFTYVMNYVSIWVIFSRFQTINNWSFYEVIFLYNLNLFTYGLSALFVWAPMRKLGAMVRDGTFDSMLIRPIDPFKHLLLKNFTYGFMGHIALATVIFGVCFEHLDIKWTATKIIWFVVFILGAFLIQSAMFIIGGSTSFWFVNSSPFVDSFIYGVRNFLDYPISIYNTFIKVILTFLIPYAFVNYYPSTYLLDKNSECLFTPIFQFGTPIVGIIVIGIAFLLWNSGINHYESTGS